MCSSMTSEQKAGTFCLRFARRHQCCRGGRGQLVTLTMTQQEMGRNSALSSAKSCPSEIKTITSLQTESVPVGKKIK